MPEVTLYAISYLGGVITAIAAILVCRARDEEEASEAPEHPDHSEGLHRAEMLHRANKELGQRIANQRASMFAKG